jgi:effector-binding domain-containing protein
MTEMLGTRPADAPPDVTPEIVELPERQAAVVAIEGKADELPRRIGEAFHLTMQAIGSSGAEISGPPFVRYFEFGERILAEAGFPFTGTLVPTDGVREATLPAGRAVTTTYVGPYDGIGAAWERVTAWLLERRLDRRDAPWETYLTGPDEPGPPVTGIFFPIG